MASATTPDSEEKKRVLEILKMLAAPGALPYEFELTPKPIVLSRDPRQRLLELIRLRRMVIAGSYNARLTAAITLGTIRDLESVPALIEALADPDVRVILAARDALRFMSRRPDGFALEVIGGRRPSEHTIEASQAAWKQWLGSIKPETLRE
jgi:hypothetical protein